MALTCNPTITTIAIALSAAAAFGQGTIHPIATLNGGSFAFPSGISGDSTTVVGVGGATYDIASPWTAGAGTVTMSELPLGQPSLAFTSSVDGSIDVCDAYFSILGEGPCM